MKHYKLLKKLPYTDFSVGCVYSEDSYFYRTSINGYSQEISSPEVSFLVKSYPDYWKYVGDYEKQLPKYNAHDFI